MEPSRWHLLLAQSTCISHHSVRSGQQACTLVLHAHQAPIYCLKCTSAVKHAQLSPPIDANKPAVQRHSEFAQEQHVHTFYRVNLDSMQMQVSVLAKLSYKLAGTE